VEGGGWRVEGGGWRVAGGRWRVGRYGHLQRKGDQFWELPCVGTVGQECHTPWREGRLLAMSGERARQGLGARAPLGGGAAWQAGLLGERAASMEVLRGASARCRSMDVLRGVQAKVEVGAERGGGRGE
jgi:hypothetical protein